MSPTAATASAVFLRRPLRRDELPSTGHFELVAQALPPLKQGQLLVRNIYISVDPYLFQYALLQPLPEPRQPIQSRAVGIVEESTDPSFARGTYVFGSFGWSTHAVVTVGATTTVTMADGSKRAVGGSDGLRTIDPPPTSSLAASSPLPRYLGVLGMPGLAGYAGVVRILKPRPGSQIFISTAAGAVGLVAGQVAKLLGARVVGSTSTDEKCAFLLESGFDAAVNYKTAAPGGTEEELSKVLAEHFPDGIDGYFDNVGGPMLDAVLGLANDHAAVAICGLISTLPSSSNVGAAAEGEHTWQFRYFARVLTKQIHIEGFQARNHFDLFDEYVSKMSRWLDDGAVLYRENIAQGLESLPRALLSMLDGHNTGKQLVQVSPDALEGTTTGGSKL